MIGIARCVVRRAGRGGAVGAKRWRRVRLLGAGSDDGSASVEFIGLGILLLLPLVYFLITLFAVQSAAYGASAAARDAGRAFVQAPSGEDPAVLAYWAAWVALQDHGIDLAPEDLEITCSPAPCLTPGGVVDVSIELEVTLPLVPDLFGESPASVGVTGRHTAVVDRFTSAR